jgi:hypothetical protein
MEAGFGLPGVRLASSYGGRSAEPTHLPFVQVTSQGLTENTRSGAGAICRAALWKRRHSYKIIYSGIFEAARSGRIRLILLVGAGRFELRTPCAQGRGLCGLSRQSGVCRFA